MYTDRFLQMPYSLECLLFTQLLRCLLLPECSIIALFGQFGKLGLETNCGGIWGSAADRKGKKKV